jgi:hypothetical protein
MAEQFFCTVTTERGTDCGLPAAALLSAFGESLTVYTCETHRNEMLQWVADNSSEGFAYRPLWNGHEQ